MQLEERTVGAWNIVSVLDSRIDARCADDFRASIARIAQQGHRKLLLDLSEVAFVDSTGLGAIIATLKQLGPEGDLAISGARDAVGSLFRLTRMDKVFRIFPSLDDAISALSRSPDSPASSGSAAGQN
jgi:anti-sigma B factor antagonist